MVKECPVTINNDAVTVAKFGETSIQFPSIHREAKTVFVSYENGKYIIIDKPAEEPNYVTKVTKNRKTTKGVKNKEKSKNGD